MAEGLLRLIFPPKCIFCNKILTLEADIEICEDCFLRIPFLKSGCSAGGRNLFLNRYCDGVFCVCEYKGIVKDALIRFKFHQKPSFYRALGKLIGNRIMEECSGYESNLVIDMAIGIPLYKKRLLDRGYNQAALLAGAVSREFNIPDCSAVIKRVKNTKSQRSLARYERYRNMVDAFCLVDADIIMGKTILIVDDVYTTGNTAGECARLLKENGAKRVYAAAAASGRRY